jgi:hypothetical protein
VQFIDTTKRKWCYKGFLKSFVYFILLNLSPRNVVLSRGTRIVSSKSRIGALVAKTKPMRDTFSPTHTRGSFLGCWPWEAGVSGFTPESPDFPEFSGLPRILRVLKPQRLYSGWGGYKSPSTPSYTSLSCHFDLNNFRPHLLPPLLPLAHVWWNLLWGFKRVWEQELGEC